VSSGPQDIPGKVTILIRDRIERRDSKDGLRKLASVRMLWTGASAEASAGIFSARLELEWIFKAKFSEYCHVLIRFC
jgi:hypothetical protein